LREGSWTGHASRKRKKKMQKGNENFKTQEGVQTVLLSGVIGKGGRRGGVKEFTREKEGQESGLKKVFETEIDFPKPRKGRGRKEKGGYSKKEEEGGIRSYPGKNIRDVAKRKGY